MNGSQARSSCYLSHELFDASKARASSLGYRSWGSYIAGLIRQDIITDSCHDRGRKIEGFGGGKRDQIDRLILQKTEEAITQWETVEEEEITAELMGGAVDLPRPAPRLTPADPQPRREMRRAPASRRG